MKSPIKDYLFWIKVFASAVLFVFGLFIFFDKELGTKFVVTVSGAAILIFALIRIYPIIKSKQPQEYKTMIVVEIVVNVIIGILLTYVGITHQKGDGNNAFNEFIVEKYRFLLGVVLYARGVIYFVGITFMKSEGTKIKFIVHICLLTIGVVCFARKIEVRDLSLLVAAISLLAFGYLALDSGITYNNYHNNKKKEKQVDVSKEDTKSDEVYEKDEPVVGIEEEIGDRPTVN